MKKILTSNGKPLVKDGKVFLSDGVNNGGVVVVDELPANPQENVIYQVNEISDIDVYVKTGNKTPSTLEEAIISLGLVPNLTYTLVDTLPSSPNISNLQTFNPAYVYINNDIAYTYGNAGYGNMWLGVKDLISSTTNIPHDNKGYVESIDKITESGSGVYVTYKLGVCGILKNNKYDLYTFVNNQWVNNRNIYEDVFNKIIKTFTDANVIYVPPHAFANCTLLEEVYLPKANYIFDYAFYYCTSLKDIYLGYDKSVVGIESYNVFDYCYKINVHVRPELLSAYQSNTNWAREVSDGYITLVGDYTD